ncbi:MULTISPECIES: CPXCG motif-containing cysteine-rich protein [Microbulbifer]|uniref:CPXCG motif-containing cysteine-rich protein n=1 Tax=Microbulbifer TaxID=48073 RepID=UPI001E2E2694|nr:MULTISPECIES: CPXCG motif-containing cysteine-rich protein [Microbulbifer]UHQ57062.1 CPXCG motif-containing cysteine-rich protein [Microbulbifer sp. YPW16]
MEALQEYDASCPYCGEPITLLLDLSAGSQSYIEDCQVCCRPISISVAVDPGGDFSVALQDEDSAG